MTETPQAALVRLADAQGVSLAALSRMVGRNVAYLQQFVTRGSPRFLPERERAALAVFFGVGEEVLGRAGSGDGEVAVPYLDVTAAAGAGRSGASERLRRHEALPREMLARHGIGAAHASVIDVAGDSMAPTLLDRDRLLVDNGDVHVPKAGAVFVIREGDALSVKRLQLHLGEVRIISDNAAYAERRARAGDITIVGRARLLLRTI